jgi:hypothetical protein
LFTVEEGEGGGGEEKVIKVKGYQKFKLSSYLAFCFPMTFTFARQLLKII